MSYDGPTCRKNHAASARYAKKRWQGGPIRLLHTADWHLGHELAGWPREHEHERILDEIAQLALDHAVDALIVAGDIFDHQNPSGAMTRQLSAFFGRLADEAPRLTSVVIAGNHDSAGRLDALAPLLRRANVLAAGALVWRDGGVDLQHHLAPVRRAGETVGYILAIPFLRPADLPGIDSASQSGAASPVAEGIRRLYGDAIEAARKQAGKLPLAVTGHLHIRGASLSESLSERHILIGGEHAAPSDIFSASADYVALGHLHRAQNVGPKSAPERVRYAGSPLPLSVVERSYEHGVSLVELTRGRAEVRHLPLPRPRPFLRVPAEGRLGLDQLQAGLEALRLDPELPQGDWPFVQVCLRIDEPTPGLRGQIDEICSPFPVCPLKPDVELPGRGARERTATPLLRLSELQPEDLFRQAFEDVHGAQPDQRQLACFRQLLGEVGR